MLHQRETQFKMPKAKPSAPKDFIAGGFGGVCTVIAGHPLDTIKVGFVDVNSVARCNRHYFFFFFIFPWAGSSCVERLTADEC